ncbi:MAG TPA: chlorohydrolase family protein [Thermomicrobiales bacterium]|nr:chlorohydrolase family protein [Thermomicrobiales bacterium]
MAERIRINARAIVAFQDGEHRILEDGCGVVEGNEIIHVGKGFDGQADQTIDAADRVITPGFINTHAHLAGSPLDKSFIEDRGRRQFAMSGLSEMLPARGQAIDREGQEACVDYSMAELIRTGTTTVMEIGGIGDYVADAVEKAGLRAYIGDMYRSGRWLTRDGKKMEYAWDEEAGVKGFHKAVDLIERIDGRANGRIKGFLTPAQVDTCTEELLRMSREASDRMQAPLALHVSQSVFEFDEMVQRHGMTPIEWLESIGFLSEWNILGHAILIAGSSWVQFGGDDLSILARHGASVAHCVWVFARRGIAMESFPAYLDAGVNMTLGTDTSPQSMIEGLRWTAVIGKIMSRDTQKSTAADVFNAATLNAAKMLHRDDLGRIAPGAKADLLFWDAGSTFMAPLRDPIKNIVYNAEAEDLRDVMIDGAWVQRDGRVLNVDERAASQRLQHAGERMWSEMGPGDWAGRGADELSPQTFARFEV